MSYCCPVNIMDATAALSRLPTDAVRWDQRLLLASAAVLLIRGVLLALRFAAPARRSGLSSSRLKPLSASCTEQCRGFLVWWNREEKREQS